MTEPPSRAEPPPLPPPLAERTPPERPSLPVRAVLSVMRTMGHRPFPNFSQALALVALWVVAALSLTAALLILLSVLAILARTQFAPPILAVGIINATAFAIVFVAARIWSGVPFRLLFPIRTVPWRLFFPMTLAVVGMAVLLTELDNVINYFLPMPQKWTEVFEGLVEDPWAGFLAVFLIAPITEELLFRGIVLRGFLLNYSVRKAIILSSLLFALIHMNIWQAPAAFILGVVFAWWRLHTGSLLPCLYGHALHNGLSLLAASLVGFPDPEEVAAQTELVLMPLWLDGLGLLLALAGLLGLRAAFRRRGMPPAGTAALAESVGPPPFPAFDNPAERE
jgi:membrane protease YdiL (CAAX protease family)